ncbi:hypothetical protein ACFE04_023660 [Oxalis oulophora]
MASGDEKCPLLTESVDPNPKKINLFAPKARRLRRVRSAPMVDFVTPATDGSGTFLRSDSFIGPLHPNFKKVVMYLSMYLCAGTMCFYGFRTQFKGETTNGFVDAIYFSIVTMTTVGYGDLVPNTVLTKLLACCFVFTGMAMVGLILTKAADYLVEKQEILLFKALHKKIGPSDVLREIEVHKTKYKCLTAMIVQCVLMLTGTGFLSMVEGLDIVDAFYCVCCTITTLGYGDKSFSTVGGRSFAVVWILSSTLCLGQFFLNIAELFTETKQKKLVKWVLSRTMTNLDLEAADIDNDGVVSAAEFIVYKLKEMGKIKQDDILLILEEFETLDVDQSGSLSASDIILAQSANMKN